MNVYDNGNDTVVAASLEDMAVYIDMLKFAPIDISFKIVTINN